MISGSNALARINTALTKLRHEEAHQREVGEIKAREVIALRNKIGEIAGELARLHLAEDGVPVLHDFIDQRAGTVRELMSAHDSALADAKARIAVASNELELLNQQHAELSEKLESLSDAFDRTLQDIEADGSDPEFLAAQQALEQLEAKLRRAQAKIETAEEDRIEKGKAYESDPLFMYLWNRNFGSAAYDSTGLVRALDKWVAHLVRWHEAHPNYRMLNQIPDRLAVHVEQLRKDVVAADDALAEAEKRAVAERVGADHGSELEEAARALEACNAKIEAASATLESAEQEADALASGTDDRSRQATDLYTQMIESQETRTLWEAAFKTPSPEDDRLVQALEETRRRIRAAEEGQHQAGKELEAIELKRRELQKVAKDFRRSGYDQPGTTFDNDDLVGSMLDGLLTGSMTGGRYWKQIERTAHRTGNRRRTTTRITHGSGPWGGGFPGPGGPQGGPGGFGGGPFGKGGGFGGGGDFKTGGGFGGGDFKSGGGFGG